MLNIGKPMLHCFFFKIQHRFLHKKHLLYYMYANIFWGDLTDKELMGNFKLMLAQ